MKFCNLFTFRILSCNAENASDSLPPIDFTEANDIVKTAMARRGLSDALPTDGQAYFDGSNRGGGRGGGHARGGGRGGGIPQGKSSNWTAKQFATAGTTTNHATAFHPLRGVEPHLGRRGYTSVLGWRMGSIVVRTTRIASISLS